MTDETAWDEYDRSFKRLLLVPEEPDGRLNEAIRSAFLAGRESALPDDSEIVLGLMGRSTPVGI